MQRTVLLLASCVALVTLAVVLGVRAPSARPALACTGAGYGSIETLATGAQFIVVADAVSVGDNINRAPLNTPMFTPPTTPTAAPRTSSPTPPSPPHSPSSGYTPEPFDLTGFGATLAVVQSYSSEAPRQLEVDKISRREVELAVREREAGALTDCAPDHFAHHYSRGSRYLVFAAEHPELGLHTIVRYEISGTDLILWGGGAAGLTMTASTYAHFFAGVPFEGFAGSIIGQITGDRLPLATVLRAVAFLRGDASIAPPDTGSAGLASGYR